MQKNDERIVFFTDIKITTIARNINGLPPISASQLVHLLKAEHSKGKVIRKNKSSTEWFYLADIAINPAGTQACLLINKSDRRTADPTFTNPEANERRVIPKRSGEGQDYSVHLLLHLKPVAKSTSTYQLLIESCTGITTYHISKFLNDALKQVATANPSIYVVNHPDGSVDHQGNPRKIKTHSKIELRGHICEDFKDELNNGKIDTIEVFTESNQKTAWDSQGVVIEKKSSVILGLAKQKSKIKNLPVIQNLFNKAKKRYEQARISFKTEEGITRTIRLHTDTMQIANDYKYIKKVKITDFEKKLLDSYENIHEPILKAMQKI